MGLWDETCGLTNTPIFLKQRCVVVLLEPSVETRGFDRGWSFADQVIAIHKGPYNGYGGTGDVVPRRGEVAAILFHAKAWDATVARHGSFEARSANAWRKLNGKPEIPEMGEFVSILNIADSARRDVLSGLKYKGQQEPLKNWREPYVFVADLTLSCLSRRGQKRKSAP